MRFIVVTGATGGIGSALCRTLASEGAGIALVGRRGDALARLAEELGPSADRVVTVEADLRDDTGLAAVAEELRGTVDGIDALVHAAGVFHRGRIEDTEVEAFDDLHRTNTRARFALTRALLPLLRSSRGQVVFVNSSLGLVSSGEVGPYAASMHAGRALADALRDEVNESGVRVLSIYLGRTATKMQRRVHAEEGRPYHPGRLIQPETVARIVSCALALPRDAEITDLRVRPMQKPLDRDES